MKRYTEEIKQRAIELYDSCKSYTQVSKTLGVSDESVRYWCNPGLREKILNNKREKSEHFKAYNKKYYKENREKELERSREYFATHKESVNEQRRKYHSKRYSNDINYKIKFSLRNRIIDVLYSHGTKKNRRTEELIGCTVDYFITYIESKFVEGMTWDNYGRGGWVLDHIIPCASFDLSEPEQQNMCFHYTNLQPLWEIDNLKKGSKLSTDIDR